MSEGRQLTIGEKVKGVRDLLDRSKQQIAAALPKHCTPERMLRVAMTAIQRTPKLLDCDPKSLIGSIVQASQLGLEPDGILGHAYLVPFRNKKTGQRECQLIPGYKGLIDLSRRSGNISTVYAQCVYEADHYQFAYGLEPRLEHTPTHEADPGPMIAAYAVARLRDGGTQFEWMWKRQIDAIRNQSMASADGPWVTHYEEMAKKTALRRLCKLLPVSVELQKAVALDEHAEAGLPQNLAAVVNFPTPAIAPPSSLDELAEKLKGDQDGGEAIDAEYSTPPPDDNAIDLAQLVEEYGLAFEAAGTKKRVKELEAQVAEDSRIQGDEKAKHQCAKYAVNAQFRLNAK